MYYLCGNSSSVQSELLCLVLAGLCDLPVCCFMIIHVFFLCTYAFKFVYRRVGIEKFYAAVLGMYADFDGMEPILAACMPILTAWSRF